MNPLGEQDNVMLQILQIVSDVEIDQITADQKYAMEELREMSDLAVLICAEVIPAKLQYSVFFLDFTCFVIIVNNPDTPENMQQLFDHSEAITILFTEDERADAIVEELGLSQGGDDG